MSFNPDLYHPLSQALKDFEPKLLVPIQDLWKGYGKVYRYQGYIIKHYRWAELQKPKTKGGVFALNRKLSSFKNEVDWYKNEPLPALSTQFPRCIFSKVTEDEIVLVLSDLSTEGFICDRAQIAHVEILATLRFLAQFHAEGLVKNLHAEKGGYWHLETRPHEWANMDKSRLKDNAEAIAERIDKAKFRTIIHGDPKPANYGFRSADQQIAAYDFQYWGSGIGSQDLGCYLFGVAESEEDWSKYTEMYFEALKIALNRFSERDAILAEWEMLLPYCRLDYYRFLLGWNPLHRKMSNYDPKWDIRVLS